LLLVDVGLGSRPVARNFQVGMLSLRVLGWRENEARRPKGPRIEARRAEGGRVFGEGFLPPPYQLGGLGECCKLPQWGPGQSPGDQMI